MVAAIKLKRIIIMIVKKVDKDIPLVWRVYKTPCRTKTRLKGSRLGPSSFYLKSFFVALLLTIPKQSLDFLYVL